MPDEPRAPAGWYPDGQGGQRYWDGVQWTSHTAPYSGPSAPVGAGSAAGPAKRLSPTKFFGGILLAFFLLVAVSSGLDGYTNRDSTGTGAGRVPEDGQNSNADQEPVTLSGDGEVNTDPFYLAPGDYKIRWKTVSDDCLYYGHLRAAEPSDSQRMFSADGASQGSNRLYDVPEGKYYVFVRTGASPGCGWSVTLSPVS